MKSAHIRQEKIKFSLFADNCLDKPPEAIKALGAVINELGKAARSKMNTENSDIFYFLHLK